MMAGTRTGGNTESEAVLSSISHKTKCACVCVRGLNLCAIVSGGPLYGNCNTVFNGWGPLTICTFFHLPACVVCVCLCVCVLCVCVCVCCVSV